MIRFTPLPVLLILCPAVVGPGRAAPPDKEPQKYQSKVVTIRALYSEPKATLESSLNRLGKEGWEAVASGKAGVLFRKKADQAWEYRVVKAPDSTLNGRGTDDEVLRVLLEGLAAQGWDPCLADLGNDSQVVLKRVVRAVAKKE